MKLYFFRHGETDANVRNIYQGGRDLFPLNENGFFQAAKLRDTLKTAQLPIIYSSPLERARQTAEIVASANGAKIEVMHDLHEITFGEAEGMRSREIIKTYGHEFNNPFRVTDPATLDSKIAGQESRRETSERFKAAVDYIRQTCPYDRAGISAHVTVMMFYYYDLFQVQRFFANCEYFAVEV